MNLPALATRHCQGRLPPSARLTHAEAEALLTQLHPDWQLEQDAKALMRTFRFDTFGQTMLFVQAVAWFAERENHHPELHLRYNTCTVYYQTHDVGGLSENDFIAAAKIDTLLTL